MVVPRGKTCRCSNTRRCAECRWRTLKASWQSRHPWLSAHGDPNGKLTHLSCKACQRAGEAVPIWRGATSFRACHFAGRQATAKHKRATCDPAKLLAIQAPPVADFERVLAAFKKGKANGDEGIENVGSEFKQGCGSERLAP